MIRVFVLLGQGGYWTSQGMVALAERIRNLGDTVVSTHSWNDPNDVVSTINNLPIGQKIAVPGYSLGANQLGYISKYSVRMIDLGVAYDPSWLSPLVKMLNGEYVQTAARFERLICYHNTGAWIWGGSTYTGKNVEEHNVSHTHLGIQYVEALHIKTIAAIQALK